MLVALFAVAMSLLLVMAAVGAVAIMRSTPIPRAAAITLGLVLFVGVLIGLIVTVDELQEQELNDTSEALAAVIDRPGSWWDQVCSKYREGGRAALSADFASLDLPGSAPDVEIVVWTLARYCESWKP
jgi:predicted PurR-regulated permease PerM